MSKKISELPEYLGIPQPVGDIPISIGGTTYRISPSLLSSSNGSVPYIGATANVNLGEFELKAGQISLDITPTGTAITGTTQWNEVLGTSQTTLKGGNVILKNGVDLVVRIVNKVTPNATLTKENYEAVRISGAQGQRLAVGLAQGNTDLNSADTIGLVTETILTNQEGFIITMGQLENINTTGSLQGETWTEGNVLYLSPTVAGKLTNIKPTGATGHIVVVGYVEYAHAINGKIYVKIMNGWELDELHNVYINDELNEDFLQYESTTQLWKNKALTGTLIRSKLGVTTLSGSNTGDQNLSGYALLASPTFTGTPTLPTGTIAVTQTSGDNTTKIATTAFVASALSAGLGITVSSQDTFATSKIATVTASQYNAFVTAGTVSSTTLYFITA